MSVTYYVDPLRGHDANDGLSPGQAKQTIAGALALMPEKLTEEICIKIKTNKHDERNGR